jgi:SNF2 family DNA or RNA helicase|tara:strand:+ start:22329 stop:23765 length:1437 start_codon:yes stop_codon:yes gene_type:complete
MRYKFKHQPYEHQLEALKKSWNKKEFAYFMDMGTGKSKVLIDNMCVLYDRGEITGALIVAPKGVYRNWEQGELPTHIPEHVMYDTVLWNPNQTKTQIEKQKRLYQVDDNLKIFVMNVEAFSTKKGCTEAERFLNSHQSLMAIDESTTIKNKDAKRTKSIVKIGKSAHYKRILTGSPVTKSPMDLYTQAEFLDEWLLGHSSFFSFQYEYAIVQRRSMGAHSFNQVVGYRNLDKLNGILENFSYRVKKEDCLDLPDKVYIKRSVELTDEQKSVYNSLKTFALALLEEGSVTTDTILTQLLRLQQVCSGHVKMDDGVMKTFNSAKLPELMSVLEEVDGKVIIWANFTHDIKTIEQEISKVYGAETVATYYGETESDDRQSIVNRFQDPDNPLKYFIGQPRTGGYGLTLTEAKTVVYYSNNFDLEIRLQSEDRAHRIGQTSKVTYIDIVADKTVDERILKALRNKINIASQVLAEDFREWIV